ncbi:hypothetical protein MNV49_003868 [Pseudohyphozyma bogoriensis]|nr:hypothetical protein MNV49_003868 [Pseudohyphozyma bogoriensis]
MTELLNIPSNSFPSFKGRTAFITGGSSGIGLETVKLLTSLSCNVLVADLSPPPSSIPGPGVIHFHHTDVTSYSNLLAAFRSAHARFGTYPDIVFANAGIGEVGDLFSEVSDEEIEREPKHQVVGIDLVAVANTGQPGLAMYNAAKHGVVGLLRGLRYVAPKDKVAISLVAPAITTTPLLDTPEMKHEDRSKVMLKAGIPLNTPRRIAEVVVWLAARGQAANGQGVLVQGGECVDLEAGIAKNRKAWMGETHARLYKGGSGKNVFEELREEKL